MGNIHVKLYGISYLDIWQPFCSAECSHLVNLVVGIMGKNSVK